MHNSNFKVLILKKHEKFHTPFFSFSLTLQITFDTMTLSKFRTWDPLTRDPGIQGPRTGTLRSGTHEPETYNPKTKTQRTQLFIVS